MKKDVKYIVYEFIEEFFIKPSYYIRYELKSDEELKKFLFKHQDNLKNIEIFNKSSKCKIEFKVEIG